MSLSAQMADKGPVWDGIVAKYNLRHTPFAEMAAWPFLDGIFNIGYDLIPPPDTGSVIATPCSRLDTVGAVSVIFHG